MSSFPHPTQKDQSYFPVDNGWGESWCKNKFGQDNLKARRRGITFRVIFGRVFIFAVLLLGWGRLALLGGRLSSLLSLLGRLFYNTQSQTLSTLAPTNATLASGEKDTSIHADNLSMASNLTMALSGSSTLAVSRKFHDRNRKFSPPPQTWNYRR